MRWRDEIAGLYREGVEAAHADGARLVAMAALPFMPDGDPGRACVVYAALLAMGVPEDVADAAVDYELRGMPARYPLAAPSLAVIA